MRNNLKSPLYFLMTIAFALVSCQPKTENVLPSYGNLESSNWVSTCSYQTSGAYATSTLQIVSGSYAASITLYSDSSCATAAVKIDQTGTYAASEVSLGSGTIDWTMGTYDVTPLSSAQATSYNNSNFCGYSDWQANVIKSVLAQTCGSELMPSVGDVNYDIYKIEQTSFPPFGIQAGDLEFGLTDSTYDGSTPAKRPTVYSGNLIYRQ